MSEARQYKNPECAERSGFLFPHRCQQIATGACSICGKPICNQHTDYTSEGQPACISCLRGRISKDDSADRTDDSTRDYDPSYDAAPYWYAHQHYRGYQWDERRDFQEGDEAALGEIGPDDDVDWERELGAS